MTDQLPDEAHAYCVQNGAHICQKPSGRTCIEQGCEQAAGTLWGPLWCPEHDKERLDRVLAGFAAVEAAFAELAAQIEQPVEEGGQ